MDVSSFQGNVDWPTAASNGGRFVYIKASEATGYLNPYFGQQYDGSAAAGLMRGAYHFALPDQSSGAVQANYFVDNGGGWSADGTTLPPMLDIEYNPYGATCYGLSAAAMSAWIADFSNTVHARTDRFPTIYSTRDWWNTCTGSNPGFAGTNPLFVANYSTSPGLLPAGWGFDSIWQYSDTGIFPGDQDVFNGSMTQLRRFAATADIASAATATADVCDRLVLLPVGGYVVGPRRSSRRRVSRSGRHRTELPVRSDLLLAGHRHPRPARRDPRPVPGVERSERTARPADDRRDCHS